ncbi:MAG: metallophosphoesterase [Muribaculaceae bacterium]|nr:metallophosphoesterase [Muribaculaceae bacterium]
MKIQYASDFHLENSDNAAHLQAHPLDPVGDVLILAGDISVLGKEPAAFNDFAQWCSEHFAHTFIVPGNHEYYGGADMRDTMHDWLVEVRHNVSFVNNRSLIIDGVEFFFTTLWAQVPPQAEEIVNKYMAECSSGILDGAPFRANLYTPLHQECRGWLDHALATSTASRKVIVTHHCPVRAEDPRYESNGLSNAFVNPMEDYVEHCGADAWIFGHTHYNGARGMRLGKTVLCSNQLGYAQDGVCDNYDAACVIEV